MWRLLIFSYLATTWAEPQSGRGTGRGSQLEDNNGHGWNIRLAVPGEPGNDYPTLGAIPRTTFSCSGKQSGYYADVETNCQAFRVCTIGSTYGFQSFLCPNGTLFNQAVLVCDWWMNVNCKNTEHFINKNNNKFEKLRLGPQLMKDIKKMLTHPMRNPYDKRLMKSNIIVMQDYKVPSGQLFPNGALLASSERSPTNVYVPAKQIQQNFYQYNPSDISFSASSPEPQYLPVSEKSNSFDSFQRIENYQRHGKQYTRNGFIKTTQNPVKRGKLVSNSHTGHVLQNSNSNINDNFYPSSLQATRSSQATTFTQPNAKQVPQTSNVQNKQRTQTKRRRPQNSINTRRVLHGNNQKYTNMFTETRNIQNSNTKQIGQLKKDNTLPSLPKFSKEVNGKVGRELKDNLVSRILEVPSTVITTTSEVTPQTKEYKPKSRVTIKTWIIKPQKSAKQLSYSAPYTYTRPSFPSPTSMEKLIDDTNPYVYNTPDSFMKPEKILSMEFDSREPYVYPRPTLAAKQIRPTKIETTITPTVNPTYPTFLPSSRLILPLSSPLPTNPSRYYLTPTPFTAEEQFYLPPPRDPTTLSRLYLSPNEIRKPTYFINGQLSANLKIPPPTIPFDESQNQSYRKNFTFLDILTKAKLDMSVNDIVADTGNVLRTASPPDYNQYRKDIYETSDLRKSDNILTKTTTDSGESLTSQSPLQTTPMISKSAQLITTPARNLVPPDESFVHQNSNPIAKLPFYKEPRFLNTIERTVSIKINIPEKIARYLFQNHSNANFDKLEILNTDSSNYLVLSDNKNNLLSKKNDINFIPIAKISNNKITQNISDSQALVYSFFSDSINLGREYGNLAQQEVQPSTPTPTPAQFQSLNNQQISDITNKISNLTSSQFSSNDLYNIDRNPKAVSFQSTRINQPITFTDKTNILSDYQARHIQSPDYNVPTQSTYSAKLQMPNNQQSILNDNKIYSGQLYRWPVPEVTNYIYNKPISENLLNSNTLQHQTTKMLTLQHNTTQSNTVNDLNESTHEVEIIKAETVNLGPAKLQLEPSDEPDETTSTETLTELLNNGNGISAHLQDKIVGTLPHPSEDNKIITYNKDSSYYLYTKLKENTINENASVNTPPVTITHQDAETIQNSKATDLSSFQLIPSINYELEDEDEQQQILDAFQIDEFGAPRDIVKSTSTTENSNVKEVMTSSINYSVEHPTAARRSERLQIGSLYSGPPSYAVPQSSIGSLEKIQSTSNNFNSKLEDFTSSNDNGYPRERPARQFLF